MQTIDKSNTIKEVYGCKDMVPKSFLGCKKVVLNGKAEV